MMEKLDPKTDGASLDLVEENVEALKRIFPSVATEDGVDFEVLRELLGDEVDDAQERYSFTWAGKRQARRIALTPSTGTLRPCPDQSVDWDKTRNLFIEGDNLEVLKLLQKSYHKKVKLIYIDPPYNTGNDFIYPDDYRDNLATYLRYTGQIDEEGLKTSANAETSGRFHTKWCNMMYPRLRLARNLLREDGIIFISIDNREVAALRMMCDEIFGEETFLGFVARSTGQTTGQDSGGLGTSFDFLLAYGKEPDVDLSGLPLTPKDLKRFDEEDERGQFAYDQMRKTGRNDRREERPNLYYAVEDPDGEPVFPTGPGGYESCWRFGRETYDELVEDGFILWRKTERNGHETWWPYVKYYAEGRTKRPSPLWTDLDGNKKATRDLRSLFDGVSVFDFPKPVALVDRLIQIAPNASVDDIILDFFAGSGTTAEAVLAANARDGGARRFILVQLPEPVAEGSGAAQLGLEDIAAVVRARITRVLARGTEDEQGSLMSAPAPGGFRTLRLDSSNIQAWDPDIDALDDRLLEAVENVKPDRSEADVLYELLLKYGLDLAIPIEDREIAGSTVNVVGSGALVVCLAKEVSLELVEGVGALKAELEPEVMRVVFLDSAFPDDVIKSNAVQILRHAGIEDIKSL